MTVLMCNSIYTSMYQVSFILFFSFEEQFGRNEEFIVSETCFQPRVNGYMRALGSRFWLLVTYGIGVRVTVHPRRRQWRGFKPALAAIPPYGTPKSEALPLRHPGRSLLLMW